MQELHGAVVLQRSCITVQPCVSRVEKAADPDVNAQPSDLESGALPLRHEVAGVTST